MPDKRPSPATSLQKVLHRVRARGPQEVVALAKARLAEGWHSEDVLVFFSQETRGAEAPSDPSLTFRRAIGDDAELFGRDIGTDTAKTFGDRLSDRTRCYLVLDGDRALHSSWVTKAAAWTRELRAYVQPPTGDAYIYESFTRADARGRGIYPFALRSMLVDLATDGTKRVWVAAEADNPASIRAITKAGFEEAFTISYGRKLGRLRIDPPTGPDAATGTRMVTKGPVV